MNEPTQDAEIVKPDPRQPGPMEIGRPIEPESQRTSSSQARVDAVADLIKTAMPKAGTLQLTPDESKALLSDFPDSDFVPGAGGKENLIYIEHSALRDRFNSVLGLGQWVMICRETWNEDFETAKEKKKGVRVYARCMLLIRGCYVGESVGDMDYFPHNASQNYGDAFEGAQTAALRRCAKNFGVGLQAWRKGFSEGWRERKYAQREKEQLRTEPAQPTNGNKSHKERVQAFISWLYDHVGAEIAGWTIAYLRGHTADGSDKGAALMPNEDLTGLSETALGIIRKDMNGFLDRLKDFAAANKGADEGEKFLPQEGEKETTGIISEKSVKQGTSNKKAWTLYGIKIGDVWFNTFSKSVGEAAKKGEAATIFYIEEEKGNTATAIKTDAGITRAGESKE